MQSVERIHYSKSRLNGSAGDAWIDEPEDKQVILSHWMKHYNIQYELNYHLNVRPAMQLRREIAVPWFYQFLLSVFRSRRWQHLLSHCQFLLLWELKRKIVAMWLTCTSLAYIRKTAYLHIHSIVLKVYDILISSLRGLRYSLTRSGVHNHPPKKIALIYNSHSKHTFIYSVHTTDSKWSSVPGSVNS